MEENENKQPPKKIPTGYICPISLQIMIDPVIAIPSGHSYDRPNILEHLKTASNDPLTRDYLDKDKIFSNRALKSAIEEFLNENPECKPEPLIGEKTKSTQNILADSNTESEIDQTDTDEQLLQEGLNDLESDISGYTSSGLYQSIPNINSFTGHSSLAPMPTVDNIFFTDSRIGFFQQPNAENVLLQRPQQQLNNQNTEFRELLDTSRFNSLIKAYVDTRLTTLERLTELRRQHPWMMNSINDITIRKAITKKLITFDQATLLTKEQIDTIEDANNRFWELSDNELKSKIEEFINQNINQNRTNRM